MSIKIKDRFWNCRSVYSLLSCPEHNWHTLPNSSIQSDTPKSLKLHRKLMLMFYSHVCSLIFYDIFIHFFKFMLHQKKYFLWDLIKWTSMIYWSSKLCDNVSSKWSIKGICFEGYSFIHFVCTLILLNLFIWMRFIQIYFLNITICIWQRL